jgi:hypothetical protein
MKRPRREYGPDRVAAAAVLITMAGFAFFVLFFERPMNSAEFWILCAIGLKLAPKFRVKRQAEHVPAAARAA